jgi:CRP/FNR family cyclic AMP-dependent transcriptional regulator
MSTPTPQEMTLDAIRSVPLFASLDDDAAVDLRNLLRTQDITSDTRLFRAGDAGDAMYLIESGRVRISVTDADQKEIVLAELARGDYFGEMAIIDGQQRSADATVVEDARFAVLSRESFLSFIQSNPTVALEMLSATFSRLRRTDRMLQQRVSRNVNEEQDKRMTIADRAADAIAEFGGSWKFIISAMGIIVGWIIFNSLILIRGFDPAPYQMLNLVMGIIAGLQAPIIMMSQNRQGSKDRLRADLDYQVNLKNELALNEVLRRLDVLESERLPLLFAEQNERIGELKAPAAKATNAS